MTHFLSGEHTQARLTILYRELLCILLLPLRLCVNRNDGKQHNSKHRLEKTQKEGVSGGIWFVAGKRVKWRRRRHQSLPLNKSPVANVLIYEIPTYSWCHDRSISHNLRGFSGLNGAFPSHVLSNPGGDFRWPVLLPPMLNHFTVALWDRMPQTHLPHWRLISRPVFHMTQPNNKWEINLGASNFTLIFNQFRQKYVAARSVLTGHLKLVPWQTLTARWLKVRSLFMTLEASLQNQVKHVESNRQDLILWGTKGRTACSKIDVSKSAPSLCMSQCLWRLAMLSC